MTKLSASDIPPDTATLRDIQTYIAKLAKLRGYDTDVAGEMLFLTEEIGELAKALRDFIGAQFDQKTSHKNLREELHDVLVNLLNIANLTGVDIFDAFREKELADLSRHWQKSPEISSQKINSTKSKDKK